MGREGGRDKEGYCHFHLMPMTRAGEVMKGTHAERGRKSKGAEKGCGPGDGELASRATGKEGEHHRGRVSHEDTPVRADRGQVPGGK